MIGCLRCVCVLIGCGLCLSDAGRGSPVPRAGGISAAGVWQSQSDHLTRRCPADLDPEHTAFLHSQHHRPTRDVLLQRHPAATLSHQPAGVRLTNTHTHTYTHNPSACSLLFALPGCSCWTPPAPPSSPRHKLRSTSWSSALSQVSIHPSIHPFMCSSLHPLTHHPSIFTGPAPLRCYANQSYYAFLTSSFMSFQFPNLTTFLSLMPPARVPEVRDHTVSICWLLIQYRVRERLRCWRL